MDKKKKIMIIICVGVIAALSFSLINDWNKRIASHEKKVFVANPTEQPKSQVGSACDDGNPNTKHDVYKDSNGTCVGFEMPKK